MTVEQWAPILVSALALAGGIATAWFGWKGRNAEVTAPDRLADGFVSLVAELRAEVIRLNERIDALERQRMQDVKHIAALEIQVNWLVDRIDTVLRSEFEATFEPFQYHRRKGD